MPTFFFAHKDERARNGASSADFVGANQNFSERVFLDASEQL